MTYSTPETLRAALLASKNGDSTVLARDRAELERRLAALRNGNAAEIRKAMDYQARALQALQGGSQ